MVLFSAEILRSVVWRDNNFKALASNLPGGTGWSAAGNLFNANGDTIDLQISSGTNAFASPSLGPQLPSGLSTTTYPYIVVRGRRNDATNYGVIANYNDATTTEFDFTDTSLTTRVATMPSGKILSGNGIQIVTNGSVNKTSTFDYVALCGQPPLQLFQNDLEFGTVTRLGSSGIDHAELRLNNLRGKFVSGPSAIGFGDHLHIYLGQGATPFHIYGGYIENREPVQPADEITLYSRGFGVSLLETIFLMLRQNTTIRGGVNDFIDNSVNNNSKNGVAIASGYQITVSYTHLTLPTICSV